MSAVGHKRTSRDVHVTSALPPIADIRRCRWACPLSANSGHQPARDLRTFSKAEGARPHTSALLYRSQRAT